MINKILLSFLFLFSSFFITEAQTTLSNSISYTVFDDGQTQVSVSYKTKPIGNTTRFKLIYKIEGQSQNLELTFKTDYTDMNQSLQTLEARVPLSSLGNFMSDQLSFDAKELVSFYKIDKYESVVKKIQLLDNLPASMKWGSWRECYRDKGLSVSFAFALSQIACDFNGPILSRYKYKIEGVLRDYPENIEANFKFIDCASNNNMGKRSILIPIGSNGFLGEKISMDMTFTGVNIEELEMLKPLKQKININVFSNKPNAGNLIGEGSYLEDDQVVLNANTTSDYYFGGWRLNGREVSSSPIYKFKASENAKYEAIFIGKYSTLEVVTNNFDGGTVSGAGKYLSGTTVTLKANPADGWTFIGWKENFNTLSTDNTFSFKLNEDKKVEVVFQRKMYQVDITKNPSKAGLVSGNSTYSFGSRVNLYAFPNSSWAFSKWIEKGKVLSKKSDYSFIVKSDHKIKAKFKQDVSTRINFGATYSYFLRPMIVTDNLFQTKVLDIANSGIKIDFGWRIIELKNVHFGISVGGMYGFNLISKSIALNNSEEETFIVTKSNIYNLNFGGEIAAGWRVVKFLLRYKNSIESNNLNFNYESNLINKNYTNYKFELRREIYQFGIRVTMRDKPKKYRKLSQSIFMDCHLNIANEFNWNWQKPQWSYQLLDKRTPDYGLGLSFSFPWITIGGDVNFNVHESTFSSSESSFKFVYLDTKIGFNLAPLFKY